MRLLSVSLIFLRCQKGCKNVRGGQFSRGKCVMWRSDAYVFCPLYASGKWSVKEYHCTSDERHMGVTIGEGASGAQVIAWCSE